MTGAAYREYQPGWCENPKCQKDLGLAQQFGGRDRKYCDAKCRVQANRIKKNLETSFRKAQLIRAEMKIESYDLDDETLRLVAELGDYGPEAIRAGIKLAHSILKRNREKLEKRGIFV